MSIPEHENLVWGKEIRTFTRPMEDISTSEWATDSANVDPALQASLICLERCARYLISRIVRHCSPFRTKKEMVKVIDDAYNLLKTGGGWTRGRQSDRVYDGSRFFRVALSPLGVYVVPSSPLERNVVMSGCRVSVKSRDIAWVKLVADAGIEAWLDSSDVLEAWRMIAVTADKANKRIVSGEPSPSTCYCSPGDREAMTHPCSKCGFPARAWTITRTATEHAKNAGSQAPICG